MARTPKSSKFFIKLPKKSGFFKDKYFLGINQSYEGDKNNISLQDLIDFLVEKKIDPSDVELASNFMITAKTN